MASTITPIIGTSAAGAAQNSNASVSAAHHASIISGEKSAQKSKVESIKQASNLKATGKERHISQEKQAEGASAGRENKPKASQLADQEHQEGQSAQHKALDVEA